MLQKRIEELRNGLHEALYLDLDEFGLEAEGNDLFSKFIGLAVGSAFQPVFRAGHRAQPLGFEALLRPAIGPDPVNPEFAFGFADTQGKLVKLDRVARTLHTLNYLALPQDRGLLFLNVHPRLVVSVNAHGKVFERVLHHHSVPTHQVVIEVLESVIDIDRQLAEAIGNYHDRGYKIAIDNFGRKHTNLDRLWKVSADFIKLDAGIIREAAVNPKARRILPGLIKIIAETGAEDVVQGIETREQLQIALDAGARNLQGYYLGRPQPGAAWHARPAAWPDQAGSAGD